MPYCLYSLHTGHLHPFDGPTDSQPQWSAYALRLLEAAMRTTRTNDEFLAELADLIKREGISSLGVGEIAARLRCSRRRLYDVADSKRRAGCLRPRAYSSKNHLPWALREILEAGVRCGEFKPMNFDAVTEVLLGAAFRLRNPYFLRRTKLTVTVAFTEAYDLVLQGLVKSPR